jgi:hypothetical protein
VADLAKWNVHGPVASLKTEFAEWDLHSGYWKPAGHFTVATFGRDGGISTTDSYNPHGSVAHSPRLYDDSGRLIENRSWMNDGTRTGLRPRCWLRCSAVANSSYGKSCPLVSFAFSHLKKVVTHNAVS